MYQVKNSTQSMNITGLISVPQYQQCTISIVFSNEAGSSEPFILAFGKYSIVLVFTIQCNVNVHVFHIIIQTPLLHHHLLLLMEQLLHLHQYLHQVSDWQVLIIVADQERELAQGQGEQ